MIDTQDSIQDWERCARMHCRRHPTERRDEFAYCWQHARQYDDDRRVRNALLLEYHAHD